MKQQEEYQKKITDPYRIVIKNGRFVLKKGLKTLKRLYAISENGADREAAIFLKI